MHQHSHGQTLEGTAIESTLWWTFKICENPRNLWRLSVDEKFASIGVNSRFPFRLTEKDCGGYFTSRILMLRNETTLPWSCRQM